MSVAQDLQARLAALGGSLGDAADTIATNGIQILLDQLRAALADLAPVSADAASRGLALLGSVTDFVTEALKGDLPVADLEVALHRELDAFEALAAGFEDAAKQELVRKAGVVLRGVVMAAIFAVKIGLGVPIP